VLPRHFDRIKIMVRFLSDIPIENQSLNALLAASWPEHRERDFLRILGHSLGYVVALDGEQLIGFVNVAWDGGQHAFLLDTTVHPDFRHRGIGTQLVREAAGLCRRAGVAWVHVDFEQTLGRFYFESCGFVTTTAGLLRLD
jgi:ribosomal protein S18 acetylase RimI-like enzyme